MLCVEVRHFSCFLSVKCVLKICIITELLGNDENHRKESGHCHTDGKLFSENNGYAKKGGKVDSIKKTVRRQGATAMRKITETILQVSGKLCFAPYLWWMHVSRFPVHVPSLFSSTESVFECFFAILFYGHDQKKLCEIMIIMI